MPGLRKTLVPACRGRGDGNGVSVAMGLGGSTARCCEGESPQGDLRAALYLRANYPLGRVENPLDDLDEPVKCSSNSALRAGDLQAIIPFQESHGDTRPDVAWGCRSHCGIVNRSGAISRLSHCPTASQRVL